MARSRTGPSAARTNASLRTPVVGDNPATTTTGGPEPVAAYGIRPITPRSICTTTNDVSLARVAETSLASRSSTGPRAYGPRRTACSPSNDPDALTCVTLQKVLLSPSVRICREECADVPGQMALCGSFRSGLRKSRPRPIANLLRDVMEFLATEIE